MRSSDWSSDVCSSDLWPIQARSARETGSLSRPAAPSDRQGILRALDRHGDRAPGDKIDPCRNLVDRNANGDTLGEADPTEGGVDIGEKAPRSGGPLAVVDTRSEEHTSELQSLMRISYAVFCLKKKKHKKQTQIKT